MEVQCIPPDSSSQVVAWSKNGAPFNPSGDPNIQITKRPQAGHRSYLRMFKARPDDSANYTCVAKDSDGLKESTISEIIIYGKCC